MIPIEPVVFVGMVLMYFLGIFDEEKNLQPPTNFHIFKFGKKTLTLKWDKKSMKPNVSPKQYLYCVKIWTQEREEVFFADTNEDSICVPYFRARKNFVTIYMSHRDLEGPFGDILSFDATLFENDTTKAETSTSQLDPVAGPSAIESSS